MYAFSIVVTTVGPAGQTMIWMATAY